MPPLTSLKLCRALCQRLSSYPVSQSYHQVQILTKSFYYTTRLAEGDAMINKRKHEEEYRNKCDAKPYYEYEVRNRKSQLLAEFENLGFDKDFVMKEIDREPRLLGLELGEFSRCLQFLKSLKCRASIKEHILSLGVFRAGFEVKLRVDCLCKHGLLRREAFTVLWKEPRVVIYKMDEIEEKIDFLINKMRFNVSCLVEVPEYLGVNFEKQIVPRFNVILYLESIGALGCEVGLRSLIKLSRLRFYNLYVKPYPECQDLYSRFSKVEEKRQHPVGLWKKFLPPKYPSSREDVKNMKDFMQAQV